MQPGATESGNAPRSDERWFRSGEESEPIVLFRAGERDWSVDDAIEAAIRRGEEESLRGALLQRLAAVQAAADAEWEPDDGALQETSDRFRYAQNLISAEDAETWLERRDISIDQFSDWMYQSVCVEAFPDAVVSEDLAADEEDLAGLLRVHLWLSGGMERLSSELARRVSAALRMAEEDGGGLSALDGRSMDAAWASLKARAINDESRSRELAAARLALTRVEIETLEFDSQEQAREAVLCATRDGMTLSEVAASSGFGVQVRDVWLDEPPDPRLLSAREGAVIGPIFGDDGGIQVHRVIRRHEPSLGDPIVAARIDASIEGRLVGDLCLQYVRGAAADPA